MIANDDILTEAHRIADGATTWADLSNAFFDLANGLVARRFPDAFERAEFRKCEAYRDLHMLVEQKMKETGVVAGPHGSLAAEATKITNHPPP